jgi:hypothetical protein
LNMDGTCSTWMKRRRILRRGRPTVGRCGIGGD